MKKYSPTDLIRLGYSPERFAYAIGGGEDENDMTVYVKDNLALKIDFDSKTYPSGIVYSNKYSELTYTNGWNEYSQELFKP